MDSRWTPDGYWSPAGVHLNSVGECKVLHLGDIRNGEKVCPSCDAIISREYCIWHVRWNDTMIYSQWCDMLRSCIHTFICLHSRVSPL